MHLVSTCNDTVRTYFQVHAGLKMQIETNERRTLDLETERMTLQVCQADDHKPHRDTS